MIWAACHCCDGMVPMHQDSGPMPGSHQEATSDDRSETNIRYGRIPQRVPRRLKTIKKVEFFHGNFVLDSAVPTKLLDMCALRNEREFHSLLSGWTSKTSDNTSSHVLMPYIP
ncbi:hypothetical protein DFH29DRAFT_948941 [Suillus ampliporus]|nr:hypothetical protein DFH29DRAFT_948941 [Suillus ampliporus]